jgi:hypothetical protein
MACGLLAAPQLDTRAAAASDIAALTGFVFAVAWHRLPHLNEQFIGNLRE